MHSSSLRRWGQGAAAVGVGALLLVFPGEAARGGAFRLIHTI